MLLLANSCSKKETSVEVISIEELLSDTPQAEDSDSAIVKIPALDGTFISEINQKLYSSFDVKSHNDRTLIDRFSATSVEKSIFVSKTDSLASAHFYMYTFEDSTVTLNAFNNLLACFGSTCEEITMSENKDNVQEQPLWCGIFEKSIVILKFSAEALPYKNELKQTVFQMKEEPLKYTLNVTENKELKWD